tara:strand:+ start:495 stop:677 length:183 start_codon:yes stop_codon:yes gene_type:complete
MKVGDLVVSKALQNYAEFVPAKLVVQKTAKLGHASGPFIVTADAPDEWQPAKSFFVVSPA